MRFIKGDLVKIIKGKDKGKTGTIVKTFAECNKVIVKGINISKRHYKPTAKHPGGGIEEIPKAISVSSAIIICNHCQKPTRLNYKITGKNKFRQCNRCKETIEGNK